jgi:tetratricopeptide (TPR) repeat protein
MSSEDLRRLFVAMPYGQREGLLDHEDPKSHAKIDFDSVWSGLVLPAIPDGFTSKRADELREPGLIDQLYNEWLLDADVVVADLTFGNPNVFYELGIRQALSQRGTVLIAQARARLPFDVRNQYVLTYDYFKAPSIHEFQKGLRQAIMNAATTRRRSPVHAFLPGLYVRRFAAGEDPDSVIADLRGRISELESAVAEAGARAETERLQRRVDSANGPAELIRVYHELFRGGMTFPGVIEAAAVKLRRFGLIDHAIRLLRRAGERWPNDAALLRELGFCFRKRGPVAYTEARESFEKALAIDDADPELHGMVGGMLKRLGQYDAAYEHYKKANDLMPRNLYALVNLGTISALLQDAEGATAFYRDVIRLTNDVTARVDHWDLLCRGEAAVFLGDSALAESAYRDALKCGPPVDDIRSASEQLHFFSTNGIQVAAASELARLLDSYVRAEAPSAS